MLHATDAHALAGRLADLCLAHPVVAGVVVTVHKPEAPVQAAPEIPATRTGRIAPRDGR